MKNRIIWFTRHGNRMDFIDPEWFEKNNKSYDPPLSDDGMTQAKELGKRLKSEDIDHIFSSTFLRAVQTATCIGDLINKPVKLEPGLSEYLHRDYFPLNYEIPSINKRMGEFANIESCVNSGLKPVSHESSSESALRMIAAIEFILNKYHGEILIVSHASPIIFAIRKLMRDHSVNQIHLCGIFKLIGHEESGWIMELNNDISHLSTTYEEPPFNHFENSGTLNF